MKKWFTILASVGLVATSMVAAGLTGSRTERSDLSQLRERQEAIRAARAASPRVKAPAKAPASPILSGSKQLYGWGMGGYGAFEYTYGPAELSSAGAHNLLAQDISANSGCYFEGRILVFEIQDDAGVKMISYNPETWEPGTPMTWVGPSKMLPADVTWEPVDRKIYGAFFYDSSKVTSFSSEPSKQYLGALDPDGVSLDGAVKIGDLAVSMRGLCSDGNGQLYGIGVDRKIYKINKNTGELTENGSFTFPIIDPEQGDPNNPPFLYNDSAEMDYLTGDVFFSYMDENWDGLIIKMRPDGSNVQCVYNSTFTQDGAGPGTGYSDVIPMIWLKQQAAIQAATPQKVTDLSIAPTGTELKATASFTLPALDMDNKKLEGPVTWTITEGDLTLATGQADPGAKVVDAPFNVAEAGMHNIAVTASKGSAKGASATIQRFIGPDTPLLVNKPEVMVNGQKVSIFWDNAIAAHDGNLAPLTYKVVRQPGNVTVADATAKTLVEDNIPSKEKALYSYDVTPIAGPATGDMVSTRQAYVGEYFGLPHTDNFTSEALFNEYPVIDANGDGNTWWLNAGKYAVYSAGTQPADDYLLIGPFQLVAGNSYDFDATAGAHSAIEEVAVFVGQGTTDPTAYSTVVVPKTECNPRVSDAYLHGSFQPETSGQYYFAIKACSDANTKNLYIKNVKVTGLAPDVPAAIDGADVVPGLNSRTIVGTLPAKTLGGDAAANVTAVNIYCDNALIATVTDGVADGAKFSYVDNTQLANGSHIYRIAAVNANGEGQAQSVTAWVGTDTPGMVTNLRIWQDLNDETLLHFSMSAPARGIHGGYIDPADLKYHVDYLTLNGAADVVDAGAQPVFTLKMTPEMIAQQTLISCSVYATNSQGASGRESWNTKSVHIGPALNIPLRESWPNGTQKSGKWGGNDPNETADLPQALWDVSEGTASDTPTQDADGYMMALKASIDNGAYRLITPRITLKDSETPMLVFFFRNRPMAKEFILEVIDEDQPLRTLKTIALDAHGSDDWNRVEVPLDDFKSSKYLQFAFYGCSSKAADDVICIDNLSISDRRGSDLTLISLEAPEKAIPNQEMTFYATVRNSGSEAVDANDYKVVLNMDGKEVASLAGEALEPDESHIFNLKYTPMVVDSENPVFDVKVVYDADMNLADNSSQAVSLKRDVNDLPTPTDLVATSYSGVALSWNAANPADMPSARVTENFDSREAFSITDFEPFTLHDGDGAPTAILATSLGVLNYPNIGSPMAWQIMDPDAGAILSGAWFARSGKQFAVSFQACFAGSRDVDSNDWLISPELNGAAQRISFYVRSGMDGTPELMDFLVSSTGNAPADFKPLAENVEVPFGNSWIEHNYTLPEGTKYFAIVHKTNNGLALLLDDLTYTPAGSKPVEAELLGYNVYRDGMRINSTPVVGTRYNDESVTPGSNYTYRVAAVWSVGESEPSNEASAIAAGIASIDGGASITIAPALGGVAINGANGLPARIYTPAGVEAWSGTVTSDVMTVSLPDGIYIVAVGSQTARILVR